MKKLKTIEQIKELNKEMGYHFFSPNTMKYFRGRCNRAVYTIPTGEAYFITSEQFVNLYKADPRKYTVRKARLDGQIDTIGEFNSIDTLSEAKTIAKNLQKKAGKEFSDE